MPLEARIGWQSQMASKILEQRLPTRTSREQIPPHSSSIPLPIFDRNQGEIARTRYAIDQAKQMDPAASDGGY